MKEIDIYLLLDVVKRNGSIKKITREGLSFRDISNITNYLLNEGLLEFSENILEITKEGNRHLEELNKKFKKINKEEWIKKETTSIIPKIAKNSIFLPNQDELFFD